MTLRSAPTYFVNTYKILSNKGHLLFTEHQKFWKSIKNPFQKVTKCEIFSLKNKLKTNDFAWISHVFVISRIFCLISLVKRTANFEDDFFGNFKISKLIFDKKFSSDWHNSKSLFISNLTKNVILQSYLPQVLNQTWKPPIYVSEDR